MADDETLVERELLSTGMYLNGEDRYRGDVVKLTETQVEQLEGLDPPAVAEVGHLAKVAEEQAKAEQEAAERAEQARRQTDEDARIRREHAADRLAGDADKADKPDDAPRVEQARSSQDGPKVTRQDTTKPPRRS